MYLSEKFSFLFSQVLSLRYLGGDDTPGGACDGWEGHSSCRDHSQPGHPTACNPSGPSAAPGSSVKDNWQRNPAFRWLQLLQLHWKLVFTIDRIQDPELPLNLRRKISIPSVLSLWAAADINQFLEGKIPACFRTTSSASAWHMSKPYPHCYRSLLHQMLQCHSTSLLLRGRRLPRLILISAQ